MPWIMILAIFLSDVGILVSTAMVHAGSESMQILEQKIQAVLAEKKSSAPDPGNLVKLADLYLDLGDEHIETIKRRAAYEEGVRLAGEALEIQEGNAQAHYLYAANLGSAVQLKGVMASALTITELKAHVRRALELKPDYAPALHMMGMMLEELPWFLGGDAVAALTYLKRAAITDPSYVHARLDLARAYIKRRDLSEARRELAIILGEVSSSNSSGSDGRYREEASALLKSLQAR